MPPVLIVFSHLRGSPCGSRPQHLLSRLAGRWQVVFVEPARRCDGPARLEVQPLGDALTRLVPHTPLDLPGWHDGQLPAVQSMLARHLAERGWQADLAWLTTPMALPLAHALHPAGLVYDCMDDLALFDDAPRQLAQRESALLQRASLVFTAGPSLYESRRDRHPRVHCLPHGVDAAHFADFAGAPSLARSTPAGRPPASPETRPRLGWRGPIDARLDLALIAAVADRRPGWSLVMAGPLQGVEPAALPQRPNLQWLDEPAYAQWPALLAGWDIALLPLVLNDATRRHHPLQVLEALAAEVPVVSTPLRDVAWLYGDAVTLADPTPDAVVAACEATLAETPATRYRRTAAATSIVAMHSWQRSADTVHELLTKTLQEATGAQHPPVSTLAARRA